MADKPRNMRWGLLSLLFLGVALFSILASNAHGSYTWPTLIGLVVGFTGAGYCTYRGIKSFSWLPR